MLTRLSALTILWPLHHRAGHCVATHRATLWSVPTSSISTSAVNSCVRSLVRQASPRRLAYAA